MALRTYHFPNLLGGAGRRISFHFPDAQGMGEAIAAVTGELTFHAGFPDEIVECENVILPPPTQGIALYDLKGRRVDASALRRGAAPSQFIEAGEHIEPPRQYSRFDEPVLFLGRYFRHWGHVLTETTARLWARRAHPELTGLAATFAGGAEIEARFGSATALFSTLDGFRLLTWRDLQQPVLLRKVFAPAASFVNRASAHAGHADALREAAARLLHGGAVEADSRPVYLSRTLLPRALWTYDNEAELERALEAEGFLIVHPERMDLAAQVLLVNRHRVFVGVVGSALHNLFFALRGEEIVSHVFSTHWAPQNYVLADAVIGNESHYVYACDVDETQPGRIVLDVPAALGYLREAGLIGGR